MRAVAQRSGADTTILADTPQARPAQGNSDPGQQGRPEQTSSSRYRHLALLLLIILLAAFLRLWQLPTLPPGLYGDEAYNGVDAVMVLKGGGFPVYFAANNGREPIFIYLQTLAVAILGATPFALRLVSALIGILTVPVVYYCARVILGPGDEPRERTDLDGWLSLLAAAAMAVSFWHLSLSRLALRAVMMPLVSALAIAGFCCAWTGRRRRAYALAGLLFGLSLYTYIAARLLPLVPAVFVLGEAMVALWQRRRQSPQERQVSRQLWRERLTGLLIMAGVCCLVALPLAIAAWQTPGLVLGRAGQVSLLSEDSGPAWQPLVDNLVRVAHNFYDRGDQNLRQNLPGRPVNDLLLAALFTAGWLAALWRVRRPRYRLLLLWLAIMLLPTLLSGEAPHSLRAGGALPPLAILYAVGAGALYRVWPQAATRRHVAPVLVLAVLLVSGSITARDYFYRWATNPGLGMAFTLDSQLAAATVAQELGQSAPGRPLVVPHSLFARPQMDFALAAVPTQPSAEPVPADARFLLPPDYEPGQPLFIVRRTPLGISAAPLEPLSVAESTSLAAALANDHSLQAIRWPDSQERRQRLLTGPLPADVHLRPQASPVPLDVMFANGVRLVGYRVWPDSVAPAAGQTRVWLSLFWQINQHTQRLAATDAHAFVHLTDGQSVRATANGGIAQSYLFPWSQVNRTIQDVRSVTLPADMPGGKAYFEVGLYPAEEAHSSGPPQRIDILDGNGRPAADLVKLGAIVVGAGAPGADLSGLRPLTVRFADAIGLAGWTVTDDRSGKIHVELGWRALGRPAKDYTAFVHLLDANGQIIGQQDQPTGGAENPTSRWVPGETVRSSFDLPAGENRNAAARLRIGLYEPVSGKQLPITSSDLEGTAPGDTFLILPLGD